MEIGKDHVFKIWTVVGVLALIGIWFLPWRFQVNDDVIMMWLVSGAYTGEPESFAVFIHPLLSWTFSKLYAMWPLTQWYPAFMFLTVCLSFFFINLVIKSEIKGLEKQFLCSLTFWVICIHSLYFPQFTVIAGLAAFSGLLPFGGSGEPRRKYLPIQGLLIVFSILIRWEAFSLIALGYLFWILLTGNRQRFLMSFKSGWWVFLIFFVCLFSFQFVKTSLSDSFQEYLEFNKVRAGVVDHPVFYTLIQKDEFVRGSDWFYFSKWLFEDDLIQNEELRQLRKQLNNVFLSGEHFSDSFKRLLSIQKKEAFKSFVGFFCILLLISFTGKKAKQFLLIWVFFLLLFNYFFLVYGRVTLLFFLVLLLPVIVDQKFSVTHLKLFIPLYVILLLVLSIHTFNFLEESRGRKKMEEQLNFLFQKVPEGKLILIEGYMEENFSKKHSMINRPPFLSLGWISRSPYQSKALSSRFGMDKLSNADEYYLIGIRMEDESLEYSAYMSHIAGQFEEKLLAETHDFLMFHYKK